MADEMLALLQQIAEKLDAQGESLNTKIDDIAREQAAMRTEMNTRFERVTHRLDTLYGLATRATARADDSLSAQSRMKTDLAAIRDHLENGDRKLVREVHDDVANLRERVEAVEKQS